MALSWLQPCSNFWKTVHNNNNIRSTADLLKWRHGDHITACDQQCASHFRTGSSPGSAGNHRFPCLWCHTTGILIENVSCHMLALMPSVYFYPQSCKIQPESMACLEQGLFHFLLFISFVLGKLSPEVVQKPLISYIYLGCYQEWPENTGPQAFV